MNILVYPHELGMGGSQINAIELAAELRDRGHGVTVFAPRGMLVTMIEDLRLDYVPAPSSGTYPSWRSMAALVRLVRARQIDLVHAYEWRPAVEATFGPHLLCGTPVLMTVLSMDVPDFLPRHLPLVVGTRELLLGQRQRGQVHLMEPPIDTERNRKRDVGRARARWSVNANEVLVSVVGRLSADLGKLEGVLAAIDAIGLMSPEPPMRLLIAGDGAGLAQVRARAEMINNRLGRGAIIVAGNLIDPREAYDAADIVLGMGSSALKGMAFSKPLIVQGENGFWRGLDPESLPLFLEEGWWGHGGRGAQDLMPILSELAADPMRRHELGEFSRKVVVERFSLNEITEQLISIFDEVLASPVYPVARIHSLVRTAVEVAKFRLVMARHALFARAERRAG
jgi:glycosyltransferase involved in cell wall biosynthesis